MTSKTADTTTTQRPQRLVRIPTNPMASRPAPAPESERAAVARPTPGGSLPIESIAQDLQGAPVWRLALIAAAVALVCVVGLLAAS